MPSLLPLLIIAAAFWGQSPDCGPPDIYASVLPNDVVGLADLRTCQITLDPRLFTVAGQPCQVTIHEYGHLLGLGHAPDPSDIMYPVMQSPRWPCRW